MIVALLSQQSILASPDATPVDFTNALWLLVSSGLVFLMQPGFMCLESGLTRSKNSINVAVKNLADVGVSVGLYWAIGFGLMFGQTQSGWVGRTLFFWDAGSHPPSTVAFFVFQLMFCSTATTIVSGAVAERLRFAAYLVTAVLVSGLIYPLLGCWAWNGVNLGENQGWLGDLGFVDFAGSTVVHSTGAWVSLAVLLVIGSRSGRFLPQGEPRTIQGSNLPMAVLGAMLLWIGWIGFNGGSALEFNASVATIVLNTMVAGAAGMISAGLRSWLQSGQIQVEALINGSLAGLVAVTASCHAISSTHAFLVGALGSVAMYSVNRTLLFCKVDDAVEAIGVHGGAGVWGTIAFALFCKPEFLTPNLERWQQILVQLLGIAVCFAWSFGVTWLVLKGIDRIWPLRVSAEDEELGLNISEHGASTELYDLFQLLEQQAKTQDLSLRAPEQPFTEVGAIARRYNQVMEALEAKTQEMLDHIRQVEVLTVAASEVEADSFRPVSLDGVAQRLDSLGQLARVFQAMFLEVKTRERDLRRAKFQLEHVNQDLERRVAERTSALEAANIEILSLNERLKGENIRMETELNFTRKLQQMILPTEEELGEIVGLDIAGFMEPATEVGGDYYDVLQHEGRVRIGIGDVTGHGMESGMVMLMAQTAVRALLVNGETDPAKLLNAVNRTIYGNTQRMKSYKNMTIAILDYEAGRIRLSGQHEELIVIRNSGEVESVDTLDLGFPLGIESDISPFLAEVQVNLSAGDVAVLYTDGITEAMNLANQQYGLARLQQILVKNHERSAQEIRQAVIEDVKAFIGKQEIFDDLTLLILKQR